MRPHCSGFGVCMGSLLLLTALVVGCGDSNTPMRPSPVTGRYDGQWSGTTSQGMRITFTVSPDQKVTSMDVGYNFNGCAGMNTYPNLNLEIGNPPNPGSPSMGPGFGFGSGAPDGPNYTQVYGAFSSNTAASGSVIFGDYSGCGNSGGIWTATKK
jgi:hypothetical protein